MSQTTTPTGPTTDARDESPDRDGVIEVERDPTARGGNATMPRGTGLSSPT